MKRIYRIIMLIITLFIINTIKVQAAGLPLCNIGYGDAKSEKGYGVYRIDPFDNKYSGMSRYRIEDEDCDFWGSWCDKTVDRIDMFAGSSKDGAKITDYSFSFLDDNDVYLCEISPDNGGAALNNVSGIRTYFYLNHGHVSKIEASYTYIDKDGEEKSKEKTYSIKKRVGDTGSVSNPKITTTKFEFPIYNKIIEGYYMCNIASSGGTNKQDCVYKKQDDSLTNCIDKPFTEWQDCNNELLHTTVTATTHEFKTTSKTKTSETTGIVSGVGEQAGLAQGTSPADGYDPSNSSVKCKDISTIVDKYWKYVTILVPIALILLIVFDLIKAITASNDEQLKKSANAAFKRTIATVILLMLPILLDMLLGWFGLDLCI